MKNPFSFLLSFCFALCFLTAKAQCDGDVMSPVIVCENDMVLPNNSGECGTFIEIIIPNVFDECGILSLTNNYTGTEDATAMYPIGTTTILWTATDLNGNVSTCQQNIMVLDTEAPIIQNCPPNLVVQASVNCDHTIPNYFATLNLFIFDNCGIATYSQYPLAGTIVTGDTEVVISVTDVNGNTSDCTFTLLFVDMMAPLILNCVDDQELVADVQCQAQLPDYTQSIAVVDNCSTALTLEQIPPAGTVISQNTSVVIQILDDMGNFSSCSFNVVLAPEPIQPQDIFNDMDVCLPDVEITAAALAPGLTGIWSVSPANGVFEDPNDPTTVLTLATPDIYTVSWTITSEDNGCGVSSWTGSFLVNYYYGDPETPSAGPDQDICINSDLFLEAADPTYPMTGEWTQISGSPVIFSDIHDPTTQVFVSSPGPYVFRWTLIGFACGEPPFDETTVNVFDLPAVEVDAGPPIELCDGMAGTTLNATPVGLPFTGEWTILTGGGDILDPQNPNSQIVNVAVGWNVFLWTVTSQLCDFLSYDEVTINVFPPVASIANAGPDLEICEPQSGVQLQAEIPEYPSLGYWMAADTNPCIPIFSNINDPAAEIANLCPGVHSFIWTVGLGPCGSISSDEMTVTVLEEGSCDVVPGDLDGDGSISMEEFNEILGAFGCVGEGCSLYDLNGDGIVGMDDLFILLGSM